MRNSTAAVLVLGVMVLGAACAHAPAAGSGTARPAIADAHRISDWSGIVRIAVGSHELIEGGEAALVESTVAGLIASAGAGVKVSCLEHEGELGGNGVVHARVRLHFPERMTLEQKFTTLGLLPAAGCGSPTSQDTRRLQRFRNFFDD